MTKRKSPYDKGWAKSAPKKGQDRARMLKKCGDSCFLMPNKKSPGKSKFPVCAAGSCKKNCKGILSAMVRAEQWKHKHPSYAKAAKKSRALYAKHKCGKKRSPRTKKRTHRKRSGKRSRKRSGKRSRKRSGKRSRKRSRKHRAESDVAGDLDRLLAKQKSVVSSGVVSDVDRGLTSIRRRHKHKVHHSKHPHKGSKSRKPAPHMKNKHHCGSGSRKGYKCIGWKKSFGARCTRWKPAASLCGKKHSRKRYRPKRSKRAKKSKCVSKNMRSCKKTKGCVWRSTKKKRGPRSKCYASSLR